MEKTKQNNTLFTSSIHYILLASIFVLAVFIIAPFGEYLIDDEWAFVKSVEYLFTKNQLKILDWNPMSLIFHTFFGTLFSYIFGFSFTALKLSTVLLSFIGIVSFFFFLKELGINKNNSFLSLLLLFFNPIYFFIMFTFMTDIPFVTWLILSTLFYYKGEKDNNLTLLFIGSFFATLSLLIRQHGILIPASVVLYSLLNIKCKKNIFHKLLVSSLLPFVSFLIFEYWYFFIHGSTIMYHWQQEFFLNLIKNPIILISKLPQRLSGVLIYLGLFSIPLSASLLPLLPSIKINKLKTKISFILISLLPTLWVIWATGVNEQVMPYFPNKITPYGIMRPNEFLFGNREVMINRDVWLVITILSLLSIIIIFYLVLFTIEKKGSSFKNIISSKYTIIFFIGVIQLLYLLLFSKIFFDRYLIILIPFLIIGILISSRGLPYNKIVYSICILPYIGFSFITTVEVNSFSKVAWKSAHYLQNNNIPLMDIDGGYAWNGWNMFEFSLANQINNSRRRDPWWIQSIAPSITSKYIISLSPTITEKKFSYVNREYTVNNKFTYRSFLKNDGFVYILQRTY